MSSLRPYETISTIRTTIPEHPEVYRLYLTIIMCRVWRHLEEVLARRGDTVGIMTGIMPFAKAMAKIMTAMVLWTNQGKDLMRTDQGTDLVLAYPVAETMMAIGWMTEL